MQMVNMIRSLLREFGHISPLSSRRDRPARSSSIAGKAVLATMRGRASHEDVVAKTRLY